MLHFYNKSDKIDELKLKNILKIIYIKYQN